MAKFWCNYCASKLTNDSPASRSKHFNGKNHINSYNAYWAEVKAKYNPEYDQTQKIRASYVVPGLTDSLVTTEVEDNLDRGEPVSPFLYYGQPQDW